MTVLDPLADLCQPFDDEELPWLDRADVDVDDLRPIERRWHDDGFVILRRFVPDDLIDRYQQAWLEAHGQAITVAESEEPIGYLVDTENAAGWPDATPYMRVEALRELVTWAPLGDVLAGLIGEPMGVHLNLTGWVSTQRNWHQDGYLNPDHVADWYAAVWIALADIAPEAGPFEYVPGSHREWPPIRQAKILDALHEPPGGLDGAWPKRSERILTPMFDELIEASDRQPERFLAQRGDVLIWHARLLHRGTVPDDPEAERRALIAHYSGIDHRPDMPDPAQLGDAGWLFPIQGTTLL